jgi:hypothetical protein
MIFQGPQSQTVPAAQAPCPKLSIRPDPSHERSRVAVGFLGASRAREKPAQTGAHRPSGAEIRPHFLLTIAVPQPPPQAKSLPATPSQGPLPTSRDVCFRPWDHVLRTLQADPFAVFHRPREPRIRGVGRPVWTLLSAPLTSPATWLPDRAKPTRKQSPAATGNVRVPTTWPSPAAARLPPDTVASIRPAT